MTASRSSLRRALCSSLCAGLLFTALPAFAQSARYEIDPDHLTLAFLVEHIGYAKVLGQFRKASGSYSFDEASGQLGAVRIEVETDSATTQHNGRDRHVRGADFLNASTFPRMVFTATGGKRTGERQYEIAGELELLGRKQPLTLTATWNKSAPSPITKVHTMGVSARGSLKRSAFGMDYGVANGWVGDEVQLLIEFEAIRR
ncbi:YceI family protein [Pseudorhodoferax soli]|uniref:Polyisoprenoid-binding protein YceI n=1 Tax=Pseudorhodoferax soli TaxID=545864 RepID=A0A368XN80_9BURK|nr:YceI family protein [Pseudorhodoferax soli]RCW69315.1 polyisoprenoid-binding protein YceI [Pseudorhodoferax soli]